tara:strand:- start:32490 stop:33155 length:666 start_codon:yes stop_codon:yes gene_type:complete
MLKKKVLFVSGNLYLDPDICVVGSSKNILKKNNGLLINKFKEIIRFNRSITKCYTKNVGSKTTLRVLNNHVFLNYKIWDLTPTEQFFAKNLKKTNILITAPQMIACHDFRKNKVESNNYFFLNSKKILFYSLFRFLFNPKLVYMISNLIYNNKNLSAGMSFIMCLILSNFIPTLFGFDLTEDMKNRSHYYQKAEKPGNVHNLDLEHKILNELRIKKFLYIK